MKNIVISPRIEEQEIREIFAKADEVRTENLLVDADGDINMVDELKLILIPNDTDDPLAKYEKYYHGIQKLLKKGLPKGKRYKDIRSNVREEINIFLTRGKQKKNGRRGADSRMSYLTDMDTVLEHLIQWIANFQTTYELYETFKELNKQWTTHPSI